MSAKISILIPVYNVEAYLSKCLDSIKTQTFTDFEVLLIDDGSTDSSGTICDSYSQKDSRFKVHHRTNHGISATREYALQQSSGDYIQFIDSDDWVEPEMLKTMYETAESDQADVVSCNFDEIHPDKIIPYRFVYNSKDDFLGSVIGNNWGVVWKHLIRKSIVIENDLHFPSDINGGEDYYFMVQVLVCSHKISSVDKILYHYNRCNIGSTIWNLNEIKILEQIKATLLVSEFLVGKGLDVKFKQPLDVRKFQSKLPLLNINRKLWRSYFKETDYLMWKLPIGKRALLVCFVAKYFRL